MPIKMLRVSNIRHMGVRKQLTDLCDGDPGHCRGGVAMIEAAKEKYC